MFLGLPPWGCIPYIKAQIPGNTGACMEKLTTLVKLHNRALSKVLPKLESQLKGFKYSMADFYSFLIERINSPSKYGMSPCPNFHCIYIMCFIIVVLCLLVLSKIISTYVLIIWGRFYGREDCMLRNGSVQGHSELWRKKNSQRVRIM